VKILLMSIGTRGDCEPFLGVGEMLRKYGENVICAFPEQYRGLAEESGFPFYSLGSEFLSLLNSDARPQGYERRQRQTAENRHHAETC
jgi:sterol 3beta-glucosyltransferase